MTRSLQTPNSEPFEEAAAYPRSIRLSLAVAAPRVAPSALDAFLASRASAGAGDLDEVVIAASPVDAARERELEDWMRVHSSDPALTLSLHPCDTTPMRLWGFAMAGARGRYVAVLDARDHLAGGWVAGWEEAMTRGAGSIVWGPVDPGNLEDSCSWAAYLSEYGQFWAPLPTGGLDEAPGNNIVFPRDSLPPADALARDGFWKTFHLEALDALTRTGAQSNPAPAVRACEAMVVRVERRYRLRAYLRRRYLHGRCYGGCRLEQPDAPSRALCLGFTPLLPWLRTARVLRRLSWTKRRGSAAGPARDWPLAALGPLWLGEIAWSWGEFAGYARGAGDACEELW